MKKRIEGVSAALLLLLAVLLIFPMICLFSELDGETVKRVVTSATFGEAVRGSLVSAAIASVLTIALAYAAALATERVKLPLRRLFSVLLCLPMLVPSISNGMGLVILLGNGGILTRLLGLSSGLYGLWGIVLGSFLYAFPVAYLMLSDALRYMDAAPHEAARVLGLSPIRRFFGVTLPQLRRPLLSAFFATVALIITDYGVPMTMGGRYETVSLVLYREAVGRVDFGTGAVYGCLLLLPAILAFALDLLDRAHGRAAAQARPFQRETAKGKVFGATLLCAVLSLVMLLPTLAFLLQGFAENYPYSLRPTLSHLVRVFERGIGENLGISVAVALLVALLGTAVAFFMAYMAARTRSRVARVLHLLAMSSASVPGLVLGLGFVLAFRETPLMGTLAILIMVNGVHFLASPYLMMYSSLSSLPASLEDTGATLGLSRMRVIFGCVLPTCRRTLYEMFSYFFVNCMMTISAVSFLYSWNTKPLSLTIPEFSDQRQYEAAAIVSLLILLVNLLVRFKRR